MRVGLRMRHLGVRNLTNLLCGFKPRHLVTGVSASVIPNLTNHQCFSCKNSCLVVYLFPLVEVHMSAHSCRVFTTKEEYVSNFLRTTQSRRKAIARWNAHIARNGNVPMLIKCSICSGKETRIALKKGIIREKRPSKRLRDELKDY